MLADSLVLLPDPTWKTNLPGELLADLTTLPKSDSFQMQVPETLHLNPGILVTETNPLHRSGAELLCSL